MATTLLKQHIRGPDGKLYRAGNQELPDHIKVGTAKNYVGDGKEKSEMSSSSSPASSGEGSERASNPENEKPQPIASATSIGVSTPLPSGFPGRVALMKAKFDTMEKIDNASDEVIIGIDGIGQETLKAIREAIK